MLLIMAKRADLLLTIYYALLFSKAHLYQQLKRQKDSLLSEIITLAYIPAYLFLCFKGQIFSILRKILQSTCLK